MIWVKGLRLSRAQVGVSPLPSAFFRAAKKSTPEVLCMEYLAANFPGLVPLWAMWPVEVATIVVMDVAAVVVGYSGVGGAGDICSCHIIIRSSVQNRARRRRVSRPPSPFFLPAGSASKAERRRLRCGPATAAAAKQRTARESSKRASVAGARRRRLEQERRGRAVATAGEAAVRLGDDGACGRGWGQRRSTQAGVAVASSPPLLHLPSPVVGNTRQRRRLGEAQTTVTVAAGMQMGLPVIIVDPWRCASNLVDILQHAKSNQKSIIRILRESPCPFGVAQIRHPILKPSWSHLPAVSEDLNNEAKLPRIIAVSVTGIQFS
ncbi:hypothetical protein Taro_002132 [Colocasia esculenta]|uniref:Uncharacterized protein n=1 Tax=Colocasia esculenta TaxID=4460 RepID=A0A843TJX5_COLES|nr:hypothetical protein [Colocasia esculenta]